MSATAPLQVRDFRALWAASLVSGVGSFVQSVAAAWLMLELTGSAVWVSLVVSSTFLPLLVFGLPAGALADLFDRRRIVLATQTCMAAAAVVMAAAGAAGVLTPGLLLALSLLLGTGLAFSQPSWHALVPDLVPRELIAEAVALNSAGYNAARAVGPAVGGLIVGLAGPEWAFLLNAASFVVVVVVVASFRSGAWHGDGESSLASAMALGLRYVRFTNSFRWILLVAACFALSSAVLQAVLPSLTAVELAGDALIYGLLLGAMGVGALVGAFARGALQERAGRRLVPASIAVFGVAGIVVGAATSLTTALPAMAVAGAAWVCTLATLNAMTQLLAPAWVRGRLLSLYTMAFVGVLPVGSVLAGSLSEEVGVRPTIIGLSALSVLLGAASLRVPLPSLGDLSTPEPARTARLPPHPHAPDVEGAPVMVLNSWVVDPGDTEAFLEVMSRVRRIRLRTGAQRWWLSREVGSPARFVECYMLASWEQHLRQHRRTGQSEYELIWRARGFDRTGGPETRHLATVARAPRPRRSGRRHGGTSVGTLQRRSS